MIGNKWDNLLKDEYGKEYFKKLELNLPFNFSNDHWKLWKVSSKGNWTSQKIEF